MWHERLPLLRGGEGKGRTVSKKGASGRGIIELESVALSEIIQSEFGFLSQLIILFFSKHFPSRPSKGQFSVLVFHTFPSFIPCYEMIHTDNFRKCRLKVFFSFRGNTPVELGSLNPFFFCLYFARTSFLTRPPPPLVKKFIGDLGALLNATYLTRENYWALLLPSRHEHLLFTYMCDKLLMLSITLCPHTNAMHKIISRVIFLIKYPLITIASISRGSGIVPFVRWTVHEVPVMPTFRLVSTSYPLPVLRAP